MSDFQFLRPEWLLALIPVAFILFKLVKPRIGDSSWTNIVDPHLLKRLLVPIKQANDYPPRVLLGIAWLLAVIALAGPTWEKIPPLKFQPDVPPLVLVFDLSRSMEARDLYPSRIETAKAKLRTLMQQLPPRPVALVVYAKQAHTAMPLTLDKKLVTQVLGELSPELMPIQGSNAGSGLKLAGETLTRNGARRGDILLITDSIEEAAIATTKQLTSNGYKVSVFAIGTLAGGKVPDLDGRGYLVGKHGGAIRVAVNEPKMRTLAETGNGNYARADSSQNDIAIILDGLGKASKVTASTNDEKTEVWRERGPLFVMLLLPLALLAFRRGVIAALFICILLPPHQAEALSWDSLWWNDNQLGQRALRENKPWTARELFSDPLWRGIAEYRAKDFNAALKSFSSLNSAQAHYNRGNTLIHLGRTEEAIAAYEQTLRLQPSHADAKFNLNLIIRRLKTREESQSKPKDNDAKQSIMEEPKASDEKKSLYAEENIDIPRSQELSQKSGEAPKDLDKIGTMGGAAILFPGTEQPEGPESSGIGQGLDDGKESDRENDQIARESRQAGKNRKDKESTTKTAENLFVDPSKPTPEKDDHKTEAKSQDQSSATVPQSEEGVAKQDEEEQSDKERNSDSQNNSSLLSPDRPAQSAPISEMDEENAQAVQQWLNRISESQSDLLKEKFLREYRRHPKRSLKGDPW